MKISAVVLTRNEEKNIGRCLKSLGFAQEIIIIDNGSTDKTLKIAAGYTGKIYKFRGTDFSGARMLGCRKAGADWILYIDSDEVVTQDLRSEIMGLPESGYSAYTLIRQNYFYGTLWPLREEVTRLIKKDKLVIWQGAVHETPVIDGNIALLKNELLHFTHDDISKMVEKSNLWSEIEAYARFKNNHPPVVSWRFIRVMATAFLKSYLRDKAIMKGTEGVMESIYQSFSMFITYAKLWEMQNKTKKS